MYDFFVWFLIFSPVALVAVAGFMAVTSGRTMKRQETSLRAYLKRTYGN